MKTISTLCIIAAALLAPLASGEYTNTSPATEALVSKAHKMDTQAMEQLGDIYAEGEGVDKDPGEALNWYTFAAQNGNMSANKKLWKLEGHAARKVKLIEREFDDEATHDLLAYLYLTHQKANILKSEAVPEGIKTKPSSSPGYVMPPEYKPAIVKNKHFNSQILRFLGNLKNFFSGKAKISCFPVIYQNRSANLLIFTSAYIFTDKSMIIMG
mgnify:CR=1 FL=1